jgi:hypothetical protein
MLKGGIMRRQWISLIILSILVLAGCTQRQKPIEPAAPPVQEIFSTPSQGNNTDTELSTPLPDNVQNLLDTAKADLAQQLSIPLSEINLVMALEATWPDSSLGCPQPGAAYAQVLTDGFLIRLEANGIIHEYHGDTNGQVVSCENPEFPIILVTPGDIQDGIPWVPVN